MQTSAPFAPAAAPVDVDRDFSRAVLLRFGALVRAATRRWFRYELLGLGRVPREPALFVGNHSGIGIADVLCLLGAWTGHFGDRRRAVGLMHDLFVRAPLVGRLCRGFGAVRACPEAARAAAARGHDIVVFPGGDIDACRPFHRAREVDFGPRRGYVRLALETGRPVVPVVTLGSHHTWLLLPLDPLWDLIGLRRWSRLSRFPVPLAAAALALATALALAGAASPAWVAAALAALLVPNPVRVTSEFLAPLDLRALTAHVADPEARVELAHRIVHDALSDALRAMRHPDRHPGIAASAGGARRGASRAAREPG